MSNTNTPMVKASIDQYSEDVTRANLAQIQEPELVDKYLGRQELDVDHVLSGGHRQTRDVDLITSHIKSIAHSFASEIQYDKPPLMVFKTSETKYVIVQGEHRLQALKKLKIKQFFFDVIDIDIDSPSRPKHHVYNHWYSMISNVSNDHTPDLIPKLSQTASSMLTDISNKLLDKDDFSIANQSLAETWVLRYRPSASNDQVSRILIRIREDLGDIGTFMTIRKEKARPVAEACGLSDDVHIVSHDMINRYYYDLLCTLKKHKIVIRINSSDFALNQKQLDNIRNECIDSDAKYSLKTEKAKLRALGVSDHVLRNIEIVGFLPQGNDEPSTKIISLTNTQKLV